MGTHTVLMSRDLELTVEKSHPALRPGCVAAFTIDRAEARRQAFQRRNTRGSRGNE